MDTLRVATSWYPTPGTSGFCLLFVDTKVPRVYGSGPNPPCPTDSEEHLSPPPSRPRPRWPGDPRVYPLGVMDPVRSFRSLSSTEDTVQVSFPARFQVSV